MIITPKAGKENTKKRKLMNINLKYYQVGPSILYNRAWNLRNARMVQYRKSTYIIYSNRPREEGQEINTFSKNAAMAFVKIQCAFLMNGILQNRNEWRVENCIN